MQRNNLQLKETKVARSAPRWDVFGPHWWVAWSVVWACCLGHLSSYIRYAAVWDPDYLSINQTNAVEYYSVISICYLVSLVVGAGLIWWMQRTRSYSLMMPVGISLIALLCFLAQKPYLVLGFFLPPPPLATALIISLAGFDGLLEAGRLSRNACWACSQTVWVIGGPVLLCWLASLVVSASDPLPDPQGWFAGLVQFAALAAILFIRIPLALRALERRRSLL